MLEHLKLGENDFARKRALYTLIAQGEIILGGYKKTKIYGTLACKPGKRMKTENRVFFKNEPEAIEAGYRPCGSCLPQKYKLWKAGKLLPANKNRLMDTNNIINLLPFDGEVDYHGRILTPEAADKYLQILLDTIAWKNDEAMIFGKHFITKRKVAWYGDADFSYTYSNTTKQALAWTKELLELKQLTEQLTGTSYNSCLLNLYHTGDEGMAWHSDDEKSLGKDTSIASLSFGAERKFALRHRLTKQGTSVILENGSLLVMKGATQSNWLHSLPKTKRVTTPRVNLTFRTMIDPRKIK